MLKTTKNITLIGYSTIEEKNVEGYQAVIKEADPYDMTISKWKIDEESSKTNIKQCRQDYTEFETAVYALQDELIAQLD